MKNVISDQNYKMNQFSKKLRKKCHLTSSWNKSDLITFSTMLVFSFLCDYDSINGMTIQV